MSKIIPYRVLARQQHLSFLKHQGREYREREDYLARTRKLLFQIEAQMRQAEILQLETFRQVAHHFQIPLPFPDLGDRLGLQRFFTTNPFIQALKEFFAGRLTADECYQQLMELKDKMSEPGKERE